VREGESGSIISILSLYAMAGYKLLPAAQNIFKSASQIKANASVLDELHPAVMEGRAIAVPGPRPVGESVFPASGDIRFNALCYTYPGATSAALKNVDLTIKRNSIVAFVGASGAGKSSLADVLLGFLNATDGALTVGGQRVDRSNVRDWQRHLGYVPQNIFLIDDTIAANVAFGIGDGKPDRDRIDAALRMANLDGFVARLADGVDFVVGERGTLLSGGQRQRVGIARALYHNADVLVLDEATSALDNLTEQEIIATIVDLKRSKTIIMIAHRLSTIRSADQVVYMENGAIQDVGTFDELIARNDNFRLMTMVAAETDASAHAT
jgi:HlyD family secretion protein